MHSLQSAARRTAALVAAGLLYAASILVSAPPSLAQEPSVSWEADARAQRAMARADNALQQGRAGKAAKLLDKALQRSPAPGVLLLSRAEIALAQGDPEAAHALLDQCTTAFPARWDCPARRARLLAAQDQLGPAGELAEVAWTRGCALPEVQGLVGWHVAQTRGEDALEEWLLNQEAPFAARPCLESRHALHRRDPAGATVALAACRKARTPIQAATSLHFSRSGIPPREADAVAPAPAPADLELFQRALVDLEAGRTEAAAQALDQLVVRYPLDPELRLRAAEAARRLGFVDQARRELSAAAGVHPASVAGDPAPAGVLLAADTEVATALIAGATTVLVELLLEEGDREAARQALATARDRIGDAPSLYPARRRLEPPPPAP